jgi:hypothetical protein
MEDLFNRFTAKTPVAMMTKAALEFALEPSAVDAIFSVHADRQYERKLLFSTMVDIMALVVCGAHPSVRAAYRSVRERVPVSLTALYDKLNHVETTTIEALVAESAARLRPVVESLGIAQPWVPGFRVRVLDGNHLAATDHRLAVLRQCAAGPLPGQALVVIEPESGLIVQIVACEDGHAQERSLLDPILAAAKPHDLFIADRNFCTVGFLMGLVARQAYLAIRQHAHLPIASAGELRGCGRTETGAVYEQAITIRVGDTEWPMRRVEIHLDTPTRDGDRKMAIITSLPSEIDACQVAEVYRRRWTIESLFARIERNLQSEISALGYPQAALFGFGVALLASNVFAVVHTAMEAAKQAKPEVADMPLSDFAIIEEARAVYRGIELAFDEAVWLPFHSLSAPELAQRLRAWAAHVYWPRFRKAIRGPKKPKPPRQRFKDKPHVSTARLINENDYPVS